MDSVYLDLCQILGEKNVFTDEDMRKHTTFKAGGRVKYFVTPDNVEGLKNLLAYLKEHNMEYFVMGNGSNLLVRDEGYDGVVIKIGQNMSHCEVLDNKIKCMAGAFLSKIARDAYENSLTGLEFAAGIPGMIGGAVAMNAGAYGGEFKDVVESVTVMDKEGNVLDLKNDEMDFSYRHSIVFEKEYIVLSTVIKLEKGNKQEISEKMNGFMDARKEKQPLEYPSAGSTFKRPEGNFAGKLIMDAGLRGYTVGGACVSEKHCGFVINKDNATASDILKLMDDVAMIVKEKFDVELEPEVKIL